MAPDAIYWLRGKRFARHACGSMPPSATAAYFMDAAGGGGTNGLQADAEIVMIWAVRVARGG
jgi:hypothetical protein